MPVSRQDGQLSQHSVEEWLIEAQPLIQAMVFVRSSYGVELHAA